MEAYSDSESVRSELTANPVAPVLRNARKARKSSRPQRAAMDGYNARPEDQHGKWNHALSDRGLAGLMVGAGWWSRCWLPESLCVGHVRGTLKGFLLHLIQKRLCCAIKACRGNRKTPTTPNLLTRRPLQRSPARQLHPPRLQVIQ
jgi:hypothetical protein